MFGRIAPGFTKAEWVTRLREFQDSTTGVVPEHIPADAALNAAPPPNLDDTRFYNTMAVSYALESLGSTLAHPVSVASAITARACAKNWNLCRGKTAPGTRATGWIATHRACCPTRFISMAVRR